MERRQFTPDMERIVAPETLLSTFAVGNIPVEALLFQTGYLTVASVEYIPGRMELTLRYPNNEVKAGLNDSLLGVLCGSPSIPARHVGNLYRLPWAFPFTWWGWSSARWSETLWGSMWKRFFKV
jgi:hypothetical protein